LLRIRARSPLWRFPPKSPPTTLFSPKATSCCFLPVRCGTFPRAGSKLVLMTPKIFFFSGADPFSVFFDNASFRIMGRLHLINSRFRNNGTCSLTSFLFPWFSLAFQVSFFLNHFLFRGIFVFIANCFFFCLFSPFQPFSECPGAFPSSSCVGYRTFFRPSPPFFSYIFRLFEHLLGLLFSGGAILTLYLVFPIILRSFFPFFPKRALLIVLLRVLLALLWPSIIFAQPQCGPSLEIWNFFFFCL